MFTWFSKGSKVPAGAKRAGRQHDWKRVIGDLEYLQKVHARSHPWLSGLEPGVTDKDFQREFMRNFYDTMHRSGLTQASFEEWHKEMEPGFKARPFSRYEDPLMHFWLQRMQSDIETACERLKVTLPKAPVFGSLQTGRVNGVAADVDNPSYYLILIDDGILGFANLLSKVAAVVFPIVDLEEGGMTFSTDQDHIVRRRISMPETGMRFFDLLVAYTVHGAPHAAQPYLLETGHTHLVSVFRDAMEFFIFGHEYGHCAAGHLVEAPKASLSMTGEAPGTESEISLRMPESWDKELEADFIGLALAMETMRGQGYSPNLSYVGVELVFTGIDYLQRALSLLEFGEERERMIDTHPPALIRRQALRQSSLSLLGEELGAEAHALADIVLDCLEFYWRPVAPALLRMHADGVRPHPRWQQKQH